MAIGWALRNRSGASACEDAVTGLAFGVSLTLGAALTRSSSGTFKFVPQNVHAMWTAPGGGSFGPPQAGQMMEVSVIFDAFYVDFALSGAACFLRRSRRAYYSVRETLKVSLAYENACSTR